MNWRDQLSALLRPTPMPELAPNAAALQDAMRAKRAMQTDQAVARFDEAAAAAATVTERARIGRLKVETLLDAGRLQDAAVAVEAVKASGNTGSAGAHWRIAAGLVTWGNGDLAGARENFEAADTLAHSAANGSLAALPVAFNAGIYLSEGNAVYAVKLLREALPTLSASGDLDHYAYFNGIYGRALIQSGHEGEGAAYIGKALELADHLQDKLRIRQWSLDLGERAFREGRFFDAQNHQQRALKLFDESRHAPEYVNALCAAARTHLALHDMDNARDLANKALGAAQQGDDASALVNAQGVLGSVLRASGQTADGLPYLQAAAAAPETPPEIQRQYAAALAETGRVEEATEQFNRVIAACAGSLEEALARRDLGLALLKTGQIQPAIAAWSAAIPICEAENAHALAARLYCDIGSARRDLGQPSRALKEYEAALMLLGKLGDHEVDTRGVVLSNAATTYAESGDAESADAFFNEAIAIAAKAGDRSSEGTRTGNYGWFLVIIGRPRRAISTLERAIKLSEAAEMPLHQAIQTDNLALAYDALNDLEQAFTLHERALSLIEKLNAPYWQASIQINFANTAMHLNQPERARDLLKRAATVNETLKNSDLQIRLQTSLAALALRDHQPQEAHLAEAIALARRTETRRLLAEALALDSQRLAMLGQAEAAAGAWKEAQRFYSMLHMPQAKISPAWISAGNAGSAAPPESP